MNKRLRSLRPRFTLAGVRDATQLWIIGAGPAGLLLADACVARGLRVGIIDPAPRAAWKPNYALWLDDAEALGVGGWVGQRWSVAEAHFAAGPRALERGYALLDDLRLQGDLLARLERAGAPIVAGEVQSLTHDDEGVSLACGAAGELSGLMVVDASGHDSRFVVREPGSAPAYQVAWGEHWELAPGCELDPDRMTFMDWRSSGPEERDEALPPTFLYAMPQGPRRVFVEETVLAARLPGSPAASFPALAARLHRRLAELGLRRAQTGAAAEVERCIIPMGGALPRGDQRTLAFGGAAGMVHPATGYLLTNVLRRRERVADAIAAELESWVGPGAPSRRIWRAIWTDEEVRAWRLFGFGLEVLVELDRPGIDLFFSEFFELSDSRWRGFVSASASTAELMATMLRYFAGVAGPIRGRLASALVGREGWRMLRGFAGLRR